MPDRPLVSAIMPTHDRPEFVRRSLEIFLAQDWPRKELVIVDSGQERPIETPGVVYLRARRNHIFEKVDQGIRAAAGEILIDWEDDEFYAPRRISAQVAPIVAGETRITGIGDPVMVWLPGVHWSRPRTWTDETRTARVPWWRRGGIHEGTRCFRREVLGHFTPEEARCWSKMGWLAHVEARGERVMKVPNEELWVHVRHGGNAVPLSAPNPADHIPRPEWVPAEQLEFWKSLGRSA